MKWRNPEIFIQGFQNQEVRINNPTTDRRMEIPCGNTGAEFSHVVKSLNPGQILFPA
jgi:hypothetical protein